MFAFPPRPKLATRTLHTVSHFSTNNLSLSLSLSPWFYSLSCPLPFTIPLLSSFSCDFHRSTTPAGVDVDDDDDGVWDSHELESSESKTKEGRRRKGGIRDGCRTVEEEEEKEVDVREEGW